MILHKKRNNNGFAPILRLADAKKIIIILNKKKHTTYFTPGTVLIIALIGQ